MKQFLFILQAIFLHKFTGLSLVLSAFSVFGGGGLFLHPAAISTSHTSAHCQYYAVQTGDTLSDIGVTYHVTVPEIAQVNHISDVNLIFPGQRFCIPTSYVPARVTPTRVTPTQNTPPPSTPVTVPQPVEPTGSVASMIYSVFGAYAPQALRIATCESGMNPNAYNPISIGGSHAAGVFQILYPSTWMSTPEAGSSPYNAWANILAAHAIFVRDGYNFHEWTCQ